MVTFNALDILDRETQVLQEHLHAHTYIRDVGNGAFSQFLLENSENYDNNNVTCTIMTLNLISAETRNLHEGPCLKLWQRHIY